jgi:Raf kinase inhibitor-like YbhB/YbcL family protein
MFNKALDEVFAGKKVGITIPVEKQEILKEKRSPLYLNVTRYKHLQLDSEAFTQNEIIPSRYTCDGININPSINISGIPENAKTLAIIVDDADAMEGSFCHWVIWNLPITDSIAEGEHRGLPGRNDFGFYKYNGPCPPVGTHRYHFKVYALDCQLLIPSCSGKIQLEEAMKDHVVGFGFLVGKYHMRM